MTGFQGIFLHVKKADVSGTFWGCRTKFHLDDDIWSHPDSRLWEIIF